MDGQALKRRSAHVRKSDIRVVDSSEGRRLAAFTAPRSVGSGDEHDVCYQRLSGWLAMVASHGEYLRSMAAAEMDVSTVYARIGDTLKVPVHQDALFTAHDDDGGCGVQAAAWRLKTLQQRMVEGHGAVSQAARAALRDMDALHEELRVLRASYVAAVRPLFDELTQCTERAAKRAHVLRQALGARQPTKDPFIVRLEVEALRRKQAELARRLQTQAAAQAAVLGDAEPRLARRVADTVEAFVGALGSVHRQLGAAAQRSGDALVAIDGHREWAAFVERFGAALNTIDAPEQPSVEPDADVAADAHVVRQGVVALREAGPLFRSTWQSKYGVLTAHGFFHVFRSQGDVARGAPETSVYLPSARIVARAGTLQMSAGSKFSRCRIVLQDAMPSLLRWRQLMEDTRRAAVVGGVGCTDSGLATPPDSSDEASVAGSPRLHARKPCSPPQQPSSPEQRTPPRLVRPLSVDASLQRFQFTPTRAMPQPSPLNIYMRPLDAAAYDAYDAYSPTFSSASASPSPGQAAAAQALFARARPASMCAEPLVRPASLCLDGATKPASFCSDRPADYASAIWHADVLRVPEPPAATTAVLLDPTNPYLGDFISRRGTRAARSSTASSALQTTLWRASSSTHSHVGPAEPPTLGHAQAALWRASSSTRSHVSVSAPLKTSPPPPQRLAVGPCRPSPPTSHEPIPEEPTVPKS